MNHRDEPDPRLLQGVLRILKMEACPQCDSPWDPSLKFCGSCGERNPKFSEDFFLAHEGMTFEEALQASCGSGHPEIATLQREDVERMLPYCTHCGTKLYD